MPDPSKLERFIRAGGDVSTVPDAEWEPHGGVALREKVQRFRAAGGQMDTFRMPTTTAVTATGTVTPPPDEPDATPEQMEQAMAAFAGQAGAARGPTHETTARDIYGEGNDEGVRIERLVDAGVPRADAVRQVREAEAGPAAKIVAAMHAPLSAPVNETATLLKRQQPGGDLYLAGGGKVFDESLAGGLRAGAATAFGPATAPLAPVAPLIEPVMKPIHAAGEWVTEKTGSKALGAATEIVAPIVAGAAAVKGAGAVRNAVLDAAANRVKLAERPLPEIPTGRGPVETALKADAAPSAPDAGLPSKLAAMAAPTGLDARLAKAGLTLEQAFDAAVRGREGALDMLRPADRAYIDGLVKERARAASFPKKPEMMEAVKEKVSPPEPELRFRAKTGESEPRVRAADVVRRAPPAEAAPAAPRVAETPTAASPAEPVGEGAAPTPAAPVAAPPTAPEVQKRTEPAAPAERPNPLLEQLDRPAPAEMGRGAVGSEAGAMGLPPSGKVEALAEPVRKTWEKGVVAIEDAFKKLVDTIPGAKRIRQSFLDPADVVSPGEPGKPGRLALLQRLARGQETEAAHRTGRLLDQLTDGTKGLAAADRASVYRFMGGEAPALPQSLSAKARSAVAGLMGEIDAVRQDLLSRGLITPEVYAEYPRFLRRQMLLKELEGRSRTRIGPSKAPYKIDPNEYRQDAFGAILDLSQAEAAPYAAKHGASVVVGDPVLVKFPTAAARDAFLADVTGTFKKARRDLHAQAAGEMRAAETNVRAMRAERAEIPTKAEVRELGADMELREGLAKERDRLLKPTIGDVKVDVHQAKMLHKAALDTPTKSDLVLDTFDPLTDVQRAAYGEVTDPRLAAALTLVQARHKVATFDFLDALERTGRNDPNGPWVQQPVQGQKPPAGYEAMTDAKMPPIQGKWVKTEIADFIRHAEDPRLIQASSDFMKAVVDAGGGVGRGWKESHFVLNPGTHGRNWLSIPFMSIQSGVNLLNPLNWPYFAQAVKSIATKDARYVEALREGVIKQDLASAEAFDAAAAALGKGESVPTVVGRVVGGDVTAPLARMKNRGGDVVRAARAKAGDIYSIPDDLIRFAADLKLRDAGVPTAKRMAELDATTYNYSRQGPATRLISQVPVVTPAFRFFADTIRIAHNNLRAHPVRLLETVASLYALKEIAQHVYGVSDEEQKALEQQFGKTTVATGRDDKERLRGYDMRYVHPYGQWLSGPDERVDGTAWATLQYLAAVLGGGESPILSAVQQLQTGRDRWGREVISPLDQRSLGGVAKGVGEVWRQNMAPPLAGRGFDRIRAATKGEQTSPYRPVQTVSDAILSTFAGWASGALDSRLAMQQLHRAADQVKRDMESSYRRRPPSKKSPEGARELVDALRAVDEARVRKADVLRAAQPSGGK